MALFVRGRLLVGGNGELGGLDDVKLCAVVDGVKDGLIDGRATTVTARSVAAGSLCFFCVVIRLRSGSAAGWGSLALDPAWVWSLVPALPALAVAFTGEERGSSRSTPSVCTKRCVCFSFPICFQRTGSLEGSSGAGSSASAMALSAFSAAFRVGRFGGIEKTVSVSVSFCSSVQRPYGVH